MEYVCTKTHYWLYEKHDKTSARHYQTRLQRILKELPKSDSAILRAEGWALLHELNGENSMAIKHRKREIKLIERTHDSVRKSVEAGDYDGNMGGSILRNWDSMVLKTRQTILRKLEKDG